MWGSLDPNAPESWPEDPAAKAWKDAEAAAAMQALEAAKPPRTWGETWGDIKKTASGLISAPAQFGSLSPPALADDPNITAAARVRGAVKPVSGRNEGPLTKLTETLVPAAGEAIVSGVTAPGDALSGKLPMYGPEGNTSLEAVRRGFDTASLAGGGAVGGAASRAVPAGARLAADAAKTGAPLAVAAHTPQGFYSALDEAVGKASMTRAPGQQWEATLRNAGVKPEEMDYRGITPLLKERAGQPITKEELSAHLQANPVPEIKPVDKIAMPETWANVPPEQQHAVAERYREINGGQPSGLPDWYENIAAVSRNQETSLDPIFKPPRYSEYQLPGAEGTYRERLLTMPTPNDRYIAATDAMRAKYGDMPLGKMPMTEAERTFIDRQIDAYGDNGGAYKSSHWDEPNILVHRRSTDREFPQPFTPEEQAAVAARETSQREVDAIRAQQGAVAREINATARPLDVAIQSKAYQDMKAGVITPADYRKILEGPTEHPELKPLQDRLQQLRAQEDQLRASMPEEVAPKNVRSLHAEEIQSDWHQAGRKKGYGEPQIVRDGDRWRAMSGDREIGRGRLEDFPGGDRQIIDTLKGSTVPDAPFKKTWHELAVKDMLREAVEGDYPRISWTAGGANPTNPKNLNVGGGAPNAERLASYERADAGMRGFYDKMIPDYLNKLGKKYGVKVERSTVPDKGGMSGEKAMDRMGIPKSEQEAFWAQLNENPYGPGGREEFMKQARDKGHDVFYMDIPPAMKEDIKSKGFALFEDSSAGQAAATAGALQNAERAGQKAGVDVGRGLAGASGGAEGVAAAEAAAARSAGSYQPIEGLPRKPLPVGGQPYVPGPIAAVHDIAKDYMASTGRPYVRQERYMPVDEAKAKAIAQAYEDMPHAPNDPKVKAAYKAMIDETVAQYDAAVKSGIKFEPIPAGMPDPYAETPRLAAKDVQENKHLWYFPTEQGYGADVGNPDAVKAISDNPMLQKTGRKDVNGNEMVANDLFRVVHDFFGHLKEGYGFRAAGEDNAWRTHANMYSDAAKPAVTAETRGQNSWLNYGPHGEKNRTAKTEDTVFAEQKIGVMPDWVWKDEMPPSAPSIARGRERFVDESGMAIPSPAYTKEAQSIQREIAAGPKGSGPMDLSTQKMTPDVEQRPLERYVPPRGISERMKDALENPDVISGLEESMRKGKGVADWYHTEPVRQAFIEELGKDAGAAEFKRFMDTVAATSPRSDVPTNIRNASFYYSGGDPKKKNPYPYGHVAQNLHKQNVETIARAGGWDVMQNPKPASFAENLRGNLEPVTVDTHAFRNIGMRTGDPRFLETSFTQKRSSKPSTDEEALITRFGELNPEKGIATFRPAQLHKEGRLSMKEAKNIPTFWASKPKANEYAAAEQLFRSAGNRVGLRPADAQAAAWSGAGEMTGLGTVGTHTFSELMNERILFTAKMRGEKPEKVLRDFVTGKKPLLSDTSTGVAFGSLDGREER